MNHSINYLEKRLNGDPWTFGEYGPDPQAMNCNDDCDVLPLKLAQQVKVFTWVEKLDIDRMNWCTKSCLFQTALGNCSPVSSVCIQITISDFQIACSTHAKVQLYFQVIPISSGDNRCVQILRIKMSGGVVSRARKLKQGRLRGLSNISDFEPGGQYLCPAGKQKSANFIQLHLYLSLTKHFFFFFFCLNH